MKSDEKMNMFIDYNHLIAFRFSNNSFIDLLVSEYHRFEPYLRKAITQFMADLGSHHAKDRLFQVGFFNMPQVNKIRDLKSNAIGRLMSIHGTITRTTEVKPELLYGSFKCLECGAICSNME